MSTIESITFKCIFLRFIGNHKHTNGNISREGASTASETLCGEGVLKVRQTHVATGERVLYR